MSEFKVGDRAVAKDGRNEINVEILAVEEKSYLVRNNAGKEFHAVRLTALPDVILCIPPVLLCLDSTKRPVPQGKKNIVPPLTASAVSRCVSRRKTLYVGRLFFCPMRDQPYFQFSTQVL